MASDLVECFEVAAVHHLIDESANDPTPPINGRRGGESACVSDLFIRHSQAGPCGSGHRDESGFHG